MKNWIVWLVVLIIVVAGGYASYQYLKSNQGYAPPAPTTYTGSSAMTSPVTSPSSTVYKTATSATLGTYLVGPNGMTLYVFAKDKPGVSNCTGECLTIWPPYTSPTQSVTLPANMTLITRPDGTWQFAWNWMPLYYYANDQNPGDTTGEGVGGVWHVAK